MPITTNSWNVNVDGDWTLAADWSPGTIPDSNNNVVINTASIHTITHNSGADTVTTLMVGNDHFVMNGGSLAFVASASFSLDYQQFGGTLNGAGIVSITGAGNLLGGGALGTLAFQIGGTIQIGNYTLGGSTTLTNNATTNQTAQIVIGDGTGVNAKITNSAAGTYTINGDYGVTQGAATASLVNAGSLQKTAGGGVSLVAVSVTDTGTISVANGALQFNGPSNSFVGAIGGAGQFAIGGGIDTIAAGTSITTSVFGVYDNGTKLTLGGDLTYANTFTQSSGSAINLNAHTLTLTGAASFFAANFGTPTVNGSGTLATSGATSANIFVLGGTVNWTNTGIVTQIGQNQIGDAGANAATFTNQAAGQFNIANDTNLARGAAATSSFVNSGTLAKTAGVGTSFVDVNVASTGAVAVANGMLDFRGSLNSFGGTISGAGQFALGGGSANTLANGASVTVATFDVYDSTSLTLGCNLTYANTFNQGYGTTLNLNGKTLTLSGTANFFNANFGTPTVNGAGTLATSGATTQNGLILGGSVNWSNIGTITQIAQLQIGDGGAAAATLTNAAAGHFNLANDFGISRGTAATSSINNVGAFVKTGGAGKSVVSLNFNNTGAVEVMTGALDFTGAVTGAGMMKIDAGTILELGACVAAGTFNFAAATGTLQIDNIANFNGSVTGFVSGDVLDLAGPAVASMTYTGTKVTVNLTNSTSKTFNFTSAVPALRAISDGAGGTDIVALAGPYALTTGTDIFAFASGTNSVTATAGKLTAGDALGGGSGVDTLALSGGGSFNLAALAWLSFENVNLAAGANYTVTPGNSDVGAGQLTINAAALSAANSLNVDASAATVGKFTLQGGSGVDTIVGGGAVSSILGRGGNDILTGGSGVNYYYFNTALNGATNDPTITNFHVGSDHIKLAHAIFTALPTGVLPGADFKIGIGTGATAPSEHILYNSGTGALMCDSDGNGAAAAVQFAQLSTGLGLTASSFTVY